MFSVSAEQGPAVTGRQLKPSGCSLEHAAAPHDKGGAPLSAENKRAIPYANTYEFSALSS